MSDRADDPIQRLVARANSFYEAGSYVDAERELRAALAADDRYPDRTRLKLTLGHVLMHQGEHDRAWQVLLEAEQEAEAAGDREAVLSALGTRGQILRRNNELDRALAVARGGVKGARALGNRLSEARFQNDESMVLESMGDLEGALDAVRRSDEAVRSEDEPVQRLRTSGRTASLLIKMGRTDEAHAIAVDGLARAREAADLYGEVSFLDDLARIAERRGQHADARAHWTESIRIQVRTGGWSMLLGLCREFVAHQGRGPGGHPYLWLAAQSATVAALLCGDEPRPGAMLCAVQAIVAAVHASPPEIVDAGLHDLRQKLRPDDPPADQPEPPALLDLALVLVIKWWIRMPLDEILDSVPLLDAGLGSTPLLTTLVSEPPPAARDR